MPRKKKQQKQPRRIARRGTSYEDIRPHLSAAEMKAVAVLEGRGWRVFLNTKIEETQEKDGLRRSTFRNQGRYDLVLALRAAGR